MALFAGATDALLRHSTDMKPNEGRGVLTLSCKFRLALWTGQVDLTLALWYAQRCLACRASKKLVGFAHLEAVLLGSEPVADRIDDF